VTSKCNRFTAFNFEAASSPELVINMGGAGREWQEFYSAKRFDAHPLEAPRFLARLKPLPVHHDFEFEVSLVLKRTLFDRTLGRFCERLSFDRFLLPTRFFFGVAWARGRSIVALYFGSRPMP
jgi:hypothetical protein